MSKETGKQTDIYDFIKADPPPVWSCMKTCKHAKEHVDHFPASNRKRCQYGKFQPGIGTSGKDWYERVRNNLVEHYCKFYEMEEK